MDRMSGGEPGFQFEAPPAAESLEPGQEDRFEKDRPAHQEVAPSKAAPAPAQAVPQLPVAQPTQQPTDDQTTTTQPVSSPATAGLSAADANLIEKEWVEKAKQVIGKTRSDPFTRKNEVSKIKADYIRKRFNKQIKSDDAVAA